MRRTSFATDGDAATLALPVMGPGAALPVRRLTLEEYRLFVLEGVRLLPAAERDRCRERSLRQAPRARFILRVDGKGMKAEIGKAES